VKVKCFACAALIEAEAVDALIDAFVAHGQDSHAWKHPEQAIRNYARNCGEAGERISQETERLPEIPAVTVEPVSEGRVGDWLQFFDRDAFAGNADWAACYCLEPHVPATPELPERAWRDNRAAVAARLRCGATSGYLAYAGARTVGWVNASFRSEYGLFQLVDAQGPKPASVIGVSCFVVAPAFRRHGVASALLDRVIADAAGRGAAWIEGYPHHQPKADDANHFRGARSMYEARGFQPIEQRENYTVMRRSALVHDSAPSSRAP
jgi:GNAT superfamily N-acetyltransferase